MSVSARAWRRRAPRGDSRPGRPGDLGDLAARQPALAGEPRRRGGLNALCGADRLGPEEGE